MVSQINFDITRVGEQIAAAVTLALKNVSINETPSPTPEQIGEQFGEAVRKRVVDAINTAVEKVRGEPSFGAAGLREQIFANAKLLFKLQNAGTSAAPEFDIVISDVDGQTFAEVVKLTQKEDETLGTDCTLNETLSDPGYTWWYDNSVQPKVLPGRLALDNFMRGSASSCDIGSLQALYVESKRHVEQIKEGWALADKKAADLLELRGNIFLKVDDLIMADHSAFKDWSYIRVPRKTLKREILESVVSERTILFVHSRQSGRRSAGVYYTNKFLLGGTKPRRCEDLLVKGDEADTDSEAMENLLKKAQAELDKTCN